MIKNNVKQLRTARNVTQEELAVSCGVSRQTVIAIEKGHYIPSLLLALEVAKYFKLPVERIFQLEQ